VAGIMFRETESNMIKVSMRSADHFDVNKIAKYFGGGGHKNASGCSLKGPLNSAKSTLLKHIEKLIK
jgi:phosphoesterase RecJ-like protein